MEPQLPFSVEKTLLKAPFASMRMSALERVGPKAAEIRPTPGARRLFRFVQACAYGSPLPVVGVLVFMQIRAHSAHPAGTLFAKWVWFVLAAVIVADVAISPFVLRLFRRLLLPEPTRIDLAKGILTLPQPMPTPLAALLRGSSAAPREVQLRDVAALQICAGMSEGEGSHAKGLAQQQRGFRVFQLNLILSRPAGERLAVMSHGKEAYLRDDARSLAKLLSVPLLDHSSEQVTAGKGRAS